MEDEVEGCRCVTQRTDRKAKKKKRGKDYKYKREMLKSKYISCVKTQNTFTFSSMPDIKTHVTFLTTSWHVLHQARAGRHQRQKLCRKLDAPGRVLLLHFPESLEEPGALSSVLHTQHTRYSNFEQETSLLLSDRKLLASVRNWKVCI